jgi:hypothetical protein
MTQEECADLPIWTDGVQCISCWKMSFRERLAALFFGKVWLTVVFGETQPPVALWSKKTIFLQKKENWLVQHWKALTGKIDRKAGSRDATS